MSFLVGLTQPAQKVPCLSWLDQPNQRFLTSLSSFLGGAEQSKNEPNQMIVKVLEWIFLTSGPVELVPSQPPVFELSSMSPAGIMIIFHLIIIPFILLKMKGDPLFEDKLPPSFFIVALLLLFFEPAKVALCYSTTGGNPIEFYPAPPEEAELPEPLSPPPEIPELPQPGTRIGDANCPSGSVCSS